MGRPWKRLLLFCLLFCATFLDLAVRLYEQSAMAPMPAIEFATSFRLEPELKDQIGRASEQLKTSQTRVVKLFLRQGLERMAAQGLIAR
jgi:hypothetical protein